MIQVMNRESCSSWQQQEALLTHWPKYKTILIKRPLPYRKAYFYKTEKVLCFNYPNTLTTTKLCHLWPELQCKRRFYIQTYTGVYMFLCLSVTTKSHSSRKISHALIVERNLTVPSDDINFMREKQKLQLIQIKYNQEVFIQVWLKLNFKVRHFRQLKRFSCLCTYPNLVLSEPLHQMYNAKTCRKNYFVSFILPC